jgi:hypothetical protein
MIAITMSKRIPATTRKSFNVEDDEVLPVPPPGGFPHAGQEAAPLPASAPQCAHLLMEIPPQKKL